MICFIDLFRFVSFTLNNSICEFNLNARILPIHQSCDILVAPFPLLFFQFIIAFDLRNRVVAGICCETHVCRWVEYLPRVKTEPPQLTTSHVIAVRKHLSIAVQALIIFVVVSKAPFNGQNEVSSVSLIAINQSRFFRGQKIWHSNALLRRFRFNGSRCKMSRLDWISHQKIRSYDISVI